MGHNAHVKHINNVDEKINMPLHVGFMAETLQNIKKRLSIYAFRGEKHLMVALTRGNYNFEWFTYRKEYGWMKD